MNDHIEDIMWIANNLTPEQIMVLREVGKNMKDYEKQTKNENKQRPEDSVPEAGRKD